MDEIQELKSRLYACINGWEEIPEEIIEVVRKVFEQIKEIYTENQCANASILEGIEIEETALKVRIKNKCEQDRRNEHGEGVMQIVNRMERYIEDIELCEEQASREELQDREEKQKIQFKEEFSQIGCEVKKISWTIIEMIEESITDINARQTRNLSNRGEFTEYKIEEIKQQVLEIIKRLRDDKCYELEQMFQNDEEKLRAEVLKLYEEYIENIEKSQKTAAEKFRESMNVGIPLDEQYAFAKESQNNKEVTREPQEPMGLGPII